MRPKFIIENSIGLLFDPDTRKVEIGGKKRFCDLIDLVMLEYFQYRRQQKTITIAVNKYKIEFDVTMTDIQPTIDRMRKNGLTVDPVTNLKGVLR